LEERSNGGIAALVGGVAVTVALKLAMEVVGP
jgi:hypothetical protein